MKKIILTLILIHGLIFSISAGTVSVKTAKLAGQNFLASHGAPDKILDLVFTKSAGDQPLYHIFNYDHGFVIVSADDRIIPILGYSTEGPWVVPADTLTGNNVMGWMKQYEQQIQSAIVIASEAKQTPGSSPKSEVRSPKSAVAPLLTTTWNQTWPYNEMCPGGNTMVGCVGVAMAQIMRYWNWPTQGLGGYGTADFGATTYIWANMPDNISSSNADVATICFHAAAAVGSIFGTGSTGVMWYNDQEPMTRAFINYFRYAFSTMQWVSRSGYTDEEWENLFKAELDASRPIYYRGEGVGSHAWVCDGYDGTNYFHMNWGWGGMYNGYFFLSNINPGSYNFNSYQKAIIGLQPNDGSTITANTTWSGVQTKTTRIAVADGITLTISPGATIKFATDTWLQIYGTLNAVGTPGDSATLTSVDTTANFRWHGIVLDNEFMNGTVMNDNDTTRLIYAKVQYTKESGLYLAYINRIRIDRSRFYRCSGSFNGGGIYSHTTMLSVTNTSFESCLAPYGGGAIFLQHSYPQIYRILDNTFYKCTAPQGFGGGIFLGSINSSVIVAGNTFNLCSAAGGGGMYCPAGNPNILSNKFVNNESSNSGGALYLTSSCNANITNNLMTNNKASTGAGGAFIISSNSNPCIVNNTICNNYANTGGGATNMAINCNPVFKNNIIYGNDAGMLGSQVAMGTTDCDPSFYNCDIQGGTSSFGGPGSGTNYTGTYLNNLDSIPNFVAPTTGSGTGYNGLAADWHLQLGSPCIDAGTPDTTGLYLPATDVYGSPRVFNNHVDIGAAENQCNPPVQPSVITGNISPDQFSTQVYSVTNTPGVSYSWTFPEGWVQTDGGTTNSVTVIVGLNPGNITVTPFNSVCSGPARTLTVAPKTLFVTPLTWGVASPSGSATFTVTASGSWTASSDQPWCTVTSSGSGNGTLTAIYPVNSSPAASRTANITVTATSGADPCVVTLIQAGSQFKVLNIKAYLESLYFASGIMRQAMDENGPHFETGIADQVTVELIDTMNYSNTVYSKSNVNLSIAGDISVADIPAAYASNCRLKIKHRNSIETVSYYSIYYNYSTSAYYDFTPDPFYTWGNNVKIADGKCLFWGGDVNQDGIVDSGDMNLIDNGSTAVMLGYFPEDVNGDGIVDSGDMNLTDNNNTAVIIAITP